MNSNQDDQNRSENFNNHNSLDHQSERSNDSLNNNLVDNNKNQIRSINLNIRKAEINSPDINPIPKNGKNEINSNLGSNQNFLDEQTIVKENPIGYGTEDLKQYLNKNSNNQINEIPEGQIKPWEDDRRNGAKVYELIGYTTAGKINQKSARENNQFFIKKILIVVLLITILILAIVIINPMKDEYDWKRILGINSKFSDANQELLESNDDFNLQSQIESQDNSEIP